MAIDIKKVRRWQTTFAVRKPFPGLPYPTVVVEEIQTAPSYRLDGRRRHDPGGQVVLTFSGRGGIRIAGMDHALTPGRAFLHNHRDPDICYYYPPDGREDWRFIWIAFENGVEPLIAEINRRYGYLFEAPPGSPLSNFLWQYKNRRDELLVTPPLEAAKLVHEVLGLLCGAAEQELRRSPRSMLIGEVQAFITSELENGINVNQLACRFRLSREHLSRCFAEQTGMTLCDYLTRERIRAATALLQQTRLPVKLVAERAGFSNYAVFYRAFRQATGVAPGAMRDPGPAAKSVS